MSIKKSLLGLVVLALAMMGFASSAMAAADGVIRDTAAPEGTIPVNRLLHFVGWATFNTPRADYVCHVTAEVESTTPSTGDVRVFTVPDTTKCTGTGLLSGCKLKKHETTGLPAHYTVTPPVAPNAGDIDVTGTIVIHYQFEGFLCPAEIILTLSAITLKTLNTEAKRTVTGTLNRLGNTITSSNERKSPALRSALRVSYTVRSAKKQSRSKANSN